jgi:hypothetical protein
MKTLLTCLLALFCVCAQAENPVVLLSVDRRPVSAPLLSGVSGQRIELVFTGAPAEGETRTVEAFLVSGQIATSLSKSAVNELGQVTISLPEVARVSQMVILLRSSAKEASRREGLWDLTVYPKTLTAEIKALLAKLEHDPGVTLGVFGPAENLREFLTGRHIPFEDLGNGLPRSHADRMLLLGEIAAVDHPALLESLPKEAQALLLVPDSALMPGVYARDRVLTVTLPLLPELLLRPRAQFTFLQLLEQLTKR